MAQHLGTDDLPVNIWDRQTNWTVKLGKLILHSTRWRLRLMITTCFVIFFELTFWVLKLRWSVHEDVKMRNFVSNEINTVVFAINIIKSTHKFLLVWLSISSAGIQLESHFQPCHNTSSPSPSGCACDVRASSSNQEWAQWQCKIKIEKNF
jgi:hypothetical protein